MDFGSYIATGDKLLLCGDSILYGSGASALGNAFCYKLAAKIGGSVNNQAIGGTRSAAIAGKAVALMPVLRKNPVILGTCINDILTFAASNQGVSTYEGMKSNYRAILASAFLRDNVAASNMRVTGSWVPGLSGCRSYSIGGAAMYTADANATLEWDFYGETLVVVGPTTINTIYKDVNVAIDGGAATVFHASAKVAEPYATTGLNALVFQNLGAGPHTVHISQKAGQAGVYMCVDYVGTLAEADATGSVFVSQVPNVNIPSWTWNGVTFSQQILDDANSAIAAVVAEFAGWRVKLVPVNSHYTPASQTCADGLHPNDAGHQKWFEAFMGCASQH